MHGFYQLLVWTHNHHHGRLPQMLALSKYPTEIRLEEDHQQYEDKPNNDRYNMMVTVVHLVPLDAHI